MVLEAVIFDWGGTLTSHTVRAEESRDRWGLAAALLAPAHALALTDLLFAADQGLWERARVDHRSFQLADVFDHALAALAATGVTDLGVASDRQAAADAYLAGWAAVVEHDPDARSLLEALRERGLRTGLLSNTFWPVSFHEGLLARDGLVDLFTARCYTCELDALKPAPAAFRAALELVEVTDPAHAVFVGDRADDDIAGAQRVGMRTVWRPDPLDPFAPPPPSQAPDGVIEALPELLRYVDSWR